jgi:hypothetical protein
MKENKLPITDAEKDEIIQFACQLLKADTARISCPISPHMFLIIGFNRNSRDDKHQWLDQDGLEIYYEYIDEQTVASGDTKENLIKSIESYKKALETLIEKFLQEVYENEKR